MADDRVCGCGCGEILVQRDKEGDKEFAARRFRSKACWGRAQSRGRGRAVETDDWATAARRNGGSVPDYRPYNLSPLK